MDPTPLASASDLATIVGDAETSPKVMLAIRRASGRFRGAIHHPLTRIENDTELHDGNGTRSLNLLAAPVIAIHSVTIDGDPITDAKPVRRTGILRRAAGWPEGAEIEVVYTHGLDDVPEDVNDAVLEQAELQYRVLAGVQQASTGAQSVTFGVQSSIGVTQRWTDAVARYVLNEGDRS